MKEIIGKIKFGVVGIPSDVTWFSLTDNFMGEFVNKSLNLKGGKFLQYGTKESVYYSPETFYCVEKYSNPILVGKLSEITEELAAELVELIQYTDREIDFCYKDYNSKGVIKVDGGYEESIGFKSAKESLISLLKANDCWIKEWNTPDEDLLSYYQDLEKWRNAPDDFLIIKL